MVDIDHSLGKGLGSLLRRIVTDALEDSDGSAECEHISLHARVEKLDLELSIGDGLRLPDQLIESLFRNPAVAPVVYVNPVCGAGRLSVDDHAKPDGCSPRRRPHD